MNLNPLTYALLAEEAYSAKPQIGAEDSSARAIIESTIDGTAFAFPGTNNLACWLADLDCGVVGTGLGRVHNGFNSSALSILSEIETKLSTMPPPAILCGHSEGAALALLIGGYLCLAGKAPLAIFGFEPPRVTTDDILAALLNKFGVAVYLTDNGNDVVPQVPRLLQSWRHPAPLTMIGTATEPFPNATDHEMARVVAAVRAAVQIGT